MCCSAHSTHACLSQSCHSAAQQSLLHALSHGLHGVLVACYKQHLPGLTMQIAFKYISMYEAGTWYHSQQRSLYHTLVYVLT